MLGLLSITHEKTHLPLERIAKFSIEKIVESRRVDEDQSRIEMTGNDVERLHVLIVAQIIVRGWVPRCMSSYRRVFASSSEEYDAAEGVVGVGGCVCCELV